MIDSLIYFLGEERQALSNNYHFYQYLKRAKQCLCRAN